MEAGRKRGFDWLFACLWLTAAMLLVTICLAVYASGQHGATGRLAALIAGAVNWLTALGTVSLVAWLRGGPWVIHGVLGGTLLRTGIPLVTGVLLTRFDRPLANAGVFGMIVVCYLVGLFVETLLAVRLIGPTGGKLVRAA